MLEKVIEVSVEAFIEHVRMQRGWKTAKPYYYTLKKFESWLQDKGKTIDEFTVPDVELFMSGLVPRTANVFLSAIRRYARWRAENAITTEEFILEQRRLMGLYNVRPVKVPRQIRKEALSIDELAKLLDAVREDPVLYVATVVHFYFGWRPIEGTVHFMEAQIHWNERYMILKTAKAKHERILPWAEEIDGYVREWYKIMKRLIKYKHPEEFYTKHIKPIAENVLGFKITARTARKTVETQFRKRGIEQWKIDAILGHTTKIPDIYSDWTELLEDLRVIMEEKHYLLEVL